MFQCLPGLYIALFDKVPEEEAKYHPLTRFALMALARKKGRVNNAAKIIANLVLDSYWSL